MVETFLSEVHMNIKEKHVSRNANLSGGARCTSRFKFLWKPESIDCSKVEYDCDGDALINRPSYEVIILEHAMSTPLATVGLQIWRGALFLCDYLLYKGETFLTGSTVLELGSGAGLCSVVAALYSKKVFATDYDENVLTQCHNNILRNQNLISGNVLVRELNWFKPLFQGTGSNWNLKEEDGIFETQIILAADVVYDDDLTDAFFETLNYLKLHCPLSLILIALEKRMNFTLSDLEIASPMHDHFSSLLAKHWKHRFKLVPSNFPQFFDYQRDPYLEIWAIELGRCETPVTDVMED